MLLSGSDSDPALACLAGAANGRDCTFPAGRAGTGGVASADLPPKGLENGLSEKRRASELQLAAKVAMNPASATRSMGLHMRKELEDRRLVSGRIGLLTSHYNRMSKSTVQVKVRLRCIGFETKLRPRIGGR
jgi:hypothetical protein